MIDMVDISKEDLVSTGLVIETNTDNSDGNFVCTELSCDSTCPDIELC